MQKYVVIIIIIIIIISDSLVIFPQISSITTFKPIVTVANNLVLVTPDRHQRSVYTESVEV
jgi:uncharacterized protein YxeA